MIGSGSSLQAVVAVTEPLRHFLFAPSAKDVEIDELKREVQENGAMKRHISQRLERITYVLQQSLQSGYVM